MSIIKSKEHILSELRRDGVSQAEGMIPMDLVDRLKNESMAAVNAEIEKHGTTEFDDLGRVLFAPVYGGAFLDFLETKTLFDICREFMGEDLNLYTMTTSCIPPKRNNYTNRIHRDTQIIIPDFKPIVAMQILLDDFNEENGSPLFLKGSHLKTEQPSDEQFEAEAELITGKKGAVNFFDPRIWHRSTENHTDQWRCCLLPGFVRPWMKQRFNVPAMMKDVDLTNCSDDALKLLGLKNLPPESWEDFYEKGQSAFK